MFLLGRCIVFVVYLINDKEQSKPEILYNKNTLSVIQISFTALLLICLLRTKFLVSLLIRSKAEIMERPKNIIINAFCSRFHLRL